jgi:hypothetical protein
VGSMVSCFYKRSNHKYDIMVCWGDSLNFFYKKIL